MTFFQWLMTILGACLGMIAAYLIWGWMGLQQSGLVLAIPLAIGLLLGPIVLLLFVVLGSVLFRYLRGMYRLAFDPALRDRTQNWDREDWAEWWRTGSE